MENIISRVLLAQLAFHTPTHQDINLFTNHPQAPRASPTLLSAALWSKFLLSRNPKSILDLFLPSQTLIGTTRTHTTRTVEHDIVRLIIRNQSPVLPIIRPCLFHNRSVFLLKRRWGGSTGSRYLSCCAGKRKPSLEE